MSNLRGDGISRWHPWLDLVEYILTMSHLCGVHRMMLVGAFKIGRAHVWTRRSSDLDE